MHKPGSLLPTWRQFAVVLVFTLIFAWVLNRVTSTPYLIVVSRIVPVGLLQLLAFRAAGMRRLSWLQPSLARLAAVAIMAPIASFISFAAAERSNLPRYLSKVEGAGALVVMTIFALVFGLGVATVALYLERKAREREAERERDRLERERDKLERDLLDARLRLLQAQIEPHFLFNTLANVQALVESGSPQAGPVLRHLIAYLRAAVPSLGDAAATLATELRLVRAYLELMRMRMPDRLQFDLAVAPELDSLRFPAMALLTLVENAVQHGIDPSVSGGRIDVGGARDPASGQVTLWVADNGMGMSESAPPGVGLANVRTRLQACYGAGARLELHESEPHGLRVELHFHSKEAPCPTPSP